MYEFVCISYNCKAKTIIYNQVDIFYIFVIQLPCSTNCVVIHRQSLTVSNYMPYHVIYINNLENTSGHMNEAHN